MEVQRRCWERRIVEELIDEECGLVNVIWELMDMGRSEVVRDVRMK